MIGPKVRIPVGVLLVAATFFYLQFAIQALNNAPLQGALTLLAVGSLGLGAYRTFKGLAASFIVLAGTLPLLVFQILSTLAFPDESAVFIVMFGVVPLGALAVWSVGHQRQSALGQRHRGDAG